METKTEGIKNLDSTSVTYPLDLKSTSLMGILNESLSELKRVSVFFQILIIA